MKKLLIILGLIAVVATAQAQNNGYVSKITEYIILQGDTIRLDTANLADGQFIKRVNGVWQNDSGPAGTACIDSLYWDPTNGYLSWYIGGSKADSVLLDNRYVELADSGVVYVTPTDLANAIVSAEKSAFVISLPPGGDIAARVAAAVEGTDYPTGWALAAGASPVDLDINHGLGQYPTNITVDALVTGTQRLHLVGTAAHNGWVSDDDNNVTVTSLATTQTARLYIYVRFTQE